jgi:hypothetical protein
VRACDQHQITPRLLPSAEEENPKIRNAELENGELGYGVVQNRIESVACITNQTRCDTSPTISSRSLRAHCPADPKTYVAAMAVRVVVVARRTTQVAALDIASARPSNHTRSQLCHQDTITTSRPKNSGSPDATKPDVALAVRRVVGGATISAARVRTTLDPSATPANTVTAAGDT